MLEPIAPNPMQDIDFVVLWVDGSDVSLAKKRMRYLDQEGLTQKHSAAIPTRFASSNEIRYCILSILAFAPFVRNIFIVTDGQDPDLDGDLELYFPDRKDSIRIVDHKEIFRGYEEYLPTFNSTSISSMLWRIEGLAEHFVYTNDDNFQVRPTTADYWFRDSRPVLRGEWRIPPLKKILGEQWKLLLNKGILQRSDYQPRLSYYLRQWNGARLTGFRRRYFFHDHNPHPLNRQRLADYFAKHDDVLRKNISHRFRDRDQFLISSLNYHLEILEGNRNYAPMDLSYLHPIYSPAKLNRKLERAMEDDSIRNVCAQSLEMMDEDFRVRLFGWLAEVLNLERENEK